MTATHSDNGPNEEERDYDLRCWESRRRVVEGNAPSANALLQVAQSYLETQTSSAWFYERVSAILSQCGPLRNIFTDQYVDLEIFGVEHLQAMGNKPASQNPVLRALALEIFNDLKQMLHGPRL